LDAGSAGLAARLSAFCYEARMADVDKRALVAELRADLARSIAVVTRAAGEAREAATHEEAKPENDKDTRAVEAAYLAGAQADRARDLERTAATLSSLDLRSFGPGDVISAAALIELEHDGVTQHYFLAPEGGGLRADVGGVRVQVITPQSALGRELLGKEEGDLVEVTVQGRLRSYEIVRVS
jgi:transcription elongation GreA/GreB family factor